MTIEQFWNVFLDNMGLYKQLRYYESFYFARTEHAANSLLTLVLQGKKQATCSSAHAYEQDGNSAPRVHDYSIVTDWLGNPQCIIQTIAITTLPFKDVTYERCNREGEDDTLESWQHNHRHFFMDEGKELGYQFSEDMLVLFEDFKVVYTIK